MENLRSSQAERCRNPSMGNVNKYLESSKKDDAKSFC